MLAYLCDGCLWYDGSFSGKLLTDSWFRVGGELSGFQPSFGSTTMAEKLNKSMGTLLRENVVFSLLFLHRESLLFPLRRRLKNTEEDCVVESSDAFQRFLPWWRRSWWAGPGCLSDTHTETHRNRLRWLHFIQVSCSCEYLLKYLNISLMTAVYISLTFLHYWWHSSGSIQIFLHSYVNNKVLYMSYRIFSIS